MTAQSRNVRFVNLSGRTMAGEMLMSAREVDRYAVIQQVIARTMGQADAALWLVTLYPDLVPFANRTTA